MVKSAVILALSGLAALSYAAPVETRSGRSGKRGLAFGKNHQNIAEKFASGPVCWGYNWEARVSDDLTAKMPAGFEFVPMLHDGSDMFVNAFAADVEIAIAAGSKHILSINEPDQCGYGTGGTCMNLDDVIKTHEKNIQTIADKHPDVKIGSIGVNNGEGENMGLGYLSKFLDAAEKKNLRIDFVAVHWYNVPDINAFIKYMTEKVKPAARGKPVWLTEWKNNGEINLDFTKKAMDWMDSQDWIERYAYMSVDTALAPGGVLAPVGNLYASAS